MEESKNGMTASDGQEKKIRNRKKYLLICIAVILAAAALGIYNYNLPARRLERALKKAQTLMDNGSFEQASAAYERAQGINGVSPEALEGQILAELHIADQLTENASDIPSRAEAADCYGQIVQLCDRAMAAVQDPSDTRFTQSKTEADTKRKTLQDKIAADYTQVGYTVETQDRSASVQLPDGSSIPYAHYFDLVKIEDEYYPYAEIIDAALQKQMEEYFADPENDISAYVGSAGAAAKDAVYRDYVGVEGVYSGQGLLCVRMAHVKTLGNAQTNDYCGVTFRLSDCKPLTLEEAAGVTDIGLRRLVRRTIWSWIEQEGYSQIKKSDVEDFAEDLDPADIKYCIRDDGTLCLIIDQTVPFFEDRQEILQIPLPTRDDSGN